MFRQIMGTDGRRVVVPAKSLAPIPQRPFTPDDVSVERNRRVARGLLYRGKVWRIDPESQILITGAVQAATLWKGAGGAGSSLRWRNPDKDSTWTALDNSLLTFTADEMIAFGWAVLGHLDRLHDASKEIQADDPIPDPTTDPRWPL